MRKEVPACPAMRERAVIVVSSGVKTIANGARARRRAYAALATLRPVVNAESNCARLIANGASAATPIMLGANAEIVAGSGASPMAIGRTSAQLAPMNHVVRMG